MWRPAAALCTLLLLLWESTASADCPNDVVRIVSRTNGIPRTEYGVPAAFGGRLGELQKQPHPVRVSDPVNACSGEVASDLSGAVALASRGECTFVEKALAVQGAGALALVVYSNDSRSLCMSGEGEDVIIPVVSVAQESAQVLENAAAEGGTVIMTTSRRRPALSSAMLWMIAMGTVVAGALWSGQDYKDGRARSRRIALLASDDDSGNVQAQAVVVNELMAICLVLGASAMLLLLFFVLNKFVYIALLGLFVLAASQGMGVLIGSLIDRVVPRANSKTVRFGGWGEVTCSNLIAFPVALALCVLWAIFRNAPHSWIVQDFIGSGILLWALRVIRIPSLKVGTIMLSLFLIYDVFWVFLQPIITPEKKSVMVEVATAKGMNEFMPMVFRVPSIWESGLGQYSFLGYGDVLMPGLLVAYARRLDICMERNLLKGYFLHSSIGYGVGLLVTYGAQFLRLGGGRGQPALLYLVPCTLGTILSLALLRSELSILMSHKQKDEECEEGRSDEDPDPDDHHV